MQRMQDKVVLVTGAARGLGWGIARAFGQHGAAVCLTDINEEEMSRAEADLRGDGSTVMPRILDTADLSAFQATIADVLDTWGRLDVVVHNAIYMPLIRFDDLTPREWQRQIDVGLGGLYNAVRAVWEPMKSQGGGHIMGIASGSSVRGYVEEVAYCANKHGQEGFVKALALEAAAYNISVNTMGPGATIKPTRITWDELDALPAEEKAEWTDPVYLGQGFVWLSTQPPGFYNGLRFDAYPIANTVQTEGWDFDFAPEKVTLYVDDFVFRRRWYAENKET
jgi:NAD(P)-dependent dehydrogenase (short-subunit alcohol dehydrogenase family)